MKNIFLVLFLALSSALFAQVDYNANLHVTPYDGVFRQGINFDYYPPYSDIDLANLSAGNEALGISGIGASTSRPALFESFVEAWGYESRLYTFQQMGNLGMQDLTCIVGYPSEAHRDHTVYCADGVTQSKLFANLYTPIWDGGANGTPYNDDNYYAAYLYKIVSLYKGQVKFWEIWNEPGFDISYNMGYREPGDPNGNWWDQDPDPCDNILNAPIEHFVRTLRISYEIIKTIDPEAYVCLAGVGYESFLDAILRNTDNPVDGTPTSEYPLGGGAYFDVMGFHTYPDIDGSLGHYDSNINDWVRYRHSDAAVDGMTNRKNNYKDLLANYGYNGVTYPQKEWIITENNIPRVAFNGISIGSEEAQVNYITKSVVTAMQLDIRQMHPYQLADRHTVADADDEYDLMGMYLNFTGTTPYDAVVKTAEGVAYESSALALAGTTYDPVKTAEMNLPNNIRGGAFEDTLNNRYVYVLWAKTDTDLSETAAATYSFPDSFGYTTLTQKAWDFAQTNAQPNVSVTNVQLTGSPLYFFDGDEIDLGDLTLACSDTIEVSIPVGETSIDVSWDNPTALSTCPLDSTTTISLISNVVSGSAFSVGNHTIIYEATDNCGHKKACSFPIIVSSDAPSEITITCPADVIVAVPEGQDRTVVTWDDAVATTTCIDPTINLDQPGGQPSGADFVIGGHTIGYTASDMCGNFKTCNFLVTVQSAIGTCPSSILAFEKLGELDNHGYYKSINKLNWQAANTLVQNSGGYLVTINSLSENDYIQNQIDDYAFLGLNDLQTEGNLVWENGDAVDYTNYNTICDFCGDNTDYNDYAEMTPWDGTWVFEGQWAKRHFIMEMNCNAESQIQLSCGEDVNMTIPTSSVIVNWDEPTATTTCASNANVSITELSGLPSGSEFSIGTHLISYQANDDCGNISSCSFTINISPQPSDCSDMDGYTTLGTYGGHGYYLSTDREDWESAKILAGNVGGYLATMNDQEENDVLKNMLGLDMAFIGYQDATSEGSGSWANGDTSSLDLSYENSNENDYAVMNFWAGTWQMVNYQVSKQYVVEKTCEIPTPTGCDPIGGFSYLGQHGDHGYYLSSQPQNWTTAQTISGNNNGYLASINSQEENDFIQGNLGQVMPFIGYNDASAEGTGAWASNEPVTLDLSSNNTDDNDYAVMAFWDGSWQLVSGGVFKRFVMEVGCGSSSALSSSENLILSLEQNEFVAHLTWQQTSEEAIDFYLIERSADGQDFIAIDRLENTTTGISSFDYQDSEPLVGDNHYQITAVSLSGKNMVSNSQKANFAKRTEIALYPNPAGNLVTIDLQPYKGKSVSVIITNQFGKVVSNTEIDNVSSAPIEIDLANFNNGFYQVAILSNEGRLSTKKLVVMRAY